MITDPTISGADETRIHSEVAPLSRIVESGRAPESLSRGMSLAGRSEPGAACAAESVRSTLSNVTGAAPAPQSDQGADFRDNGGEHQFAATGLENFGGVDNAGPAAPGNDRAADPDCCGRSESSLAARPAQAADLAGSRVIASTAAAPLSLVRNSGLESPENPQTGMSAPRTPRAATADDIAVASTRRAALEAFRALRAAGATNEAAAKQCGYPFQTIYVWIRAHDAGGFDGLLPQHKRSGRRPAHRLNARETAEVKALVLATNRNFNSGSTPEAVRTAIKRGLLAPETADIIRARFSAGQAPLTETMRQQVRVPGTTTEADRGPRNAWLKYVQSPGSLMITQDEETGEEREIEPAEKWTLDDATINFACCVPFNLPGNQCSEQFGVMVGRFQFLLVVDHRSYFIPGFSYTARPRSSYRAEDLTATLHTVFTEHGYPRAMVLEHGVSAAKLLTETLGKLGVRIERASSPHQKVVEFVFGALWTKLSLMPGQVGRYRGEEEEVQSTLISCQRGATDPRRHFPMLADVLKALHEAIAEWNDHLVQSRQYGTWAPRALFQQFATKNLRRLEQKQAWIFSPCITAPLLIRGFKVRKAVCLMEGYSEVFDFSAEWMHEFNGALVKLHFNPFAPDCVATVVLAGNFQGRKAGEILGHAEQINRMTRLHRRALGYGEDPDIGLDATRRNAQALRRSAVAIRTDGTAGAQAHEARNGIGAGEVVTNDPRLVPPSPAERPDILSPRTPEQIARQSDRFARLAAAQKNLADQNG